MPGKHSHEVGHVCPWWFAPSFDNPLRRLIHNPRQILGDLVKEGQVVADIGCGMGYFSLGLARLVGPYGRVYAVDVQSRMLERAKMRARAAELENRLVLIECQPRAFSLPEPVDFALAFWMVHETPDQVAFFKQVWACLKPGGTFLLVEPIGHVSDHAFAQSVASAKAAGLTQLCSRRVRFSRGVLLQR